MRLRLSTLCLLAGLLASAPAAAQQPIDLANWAGAAVTEVNPVPFCLSDKVACFTAFSTAPVFDLDLAGTDETPGYAIAIEGATGPVAVGSGGVSLPVDLGANNDVQGNVAHGGAAAGNPFTTANTAVAFGANPTAVSAGQVVRSIANRAGSPFVLGGHPNIITHEWQVQDADGALTDTALVTCGAGCKVVVTEADATCDPDTSDDTNLRIGFGTANVPAGAHTGAVGIVLAWDGIPQGGGKMRGTGAGIIGVGADGEDLRMTIDDPVGGSCNIEISYFTIES